MSDYYGSIDMAKVREHYGDERHGCLDAHTPDDPVQTLNSGEGGDTIILFLT